MTWTPESEHEWSPESEHEEEDTLADLAFDAAVEGIDQWYAEAVSRRYTAAFETKICRNLLAAVQRLPPHLHGEAAIIYAQFTRRGQLADAKDGMSGTILTALNFAQGRKVTGALIGLNKNDLSQITRWYLPRATPVFDFFSSVVNYSCDRFSMPIKNREVQRIFHEKFPEADTFAYCVEDMDRFMIPFLRKIHAQNGRLSTSDEQYIQVLELAGADILRCQRLVYQEVLRSHDK